MPISLSWRTPVACAVAGAFAVMASPAYAQFTPGQEIQYRESSTVWADGVVVRMAPGDRDVIINEKPTTFFPEGFQRAYSVDQVRPRQPPPAQAGAAQGDGGQGAGGVGARAQAPIAQAPIAQAPRAAQAPAAQPPRAAPAPVAAVPQGTGLLSKEQVLAYARQELGPNPYAQPNRDTALAKIRDYIKNRGVNFQSDLAFSNQLGEIGANASHVFFAISDNYGAAPTLADYFGDFALQSQNRGSTSIQQAGGRTVRETTDSAARLGSIKINPDGTYAWNVLGDGNILRGTWREMREDEKQAWDGGPAIWLLNARGGQDYQVRGDRQPNWTGWIDVGIGKGRQAVQYGQKR